MIGTVAACLTTGAFIPQVIKTVRTKDTSGISIGMSIMQVTGMLLWLIHGLRIMDMALISANAVSVALASVILIYKAREIISAKLNRTIPTELENGRA